MKRKAADNLSVDSVKHIKTERDDTLADYSQDVKKKISASARTGQACDRCRVSMRELSIQDTRNGAAHALL